MRSVTPTIPSLLADPSPQDWLKVCKILDGLHEAAQKAPAHDKQPGSAAAELQQAIADTRKALATWPAPALKVVPREPLKHWVRSTGKGQPGHDALLDLCLRVKHESQVYGYFETYVCNDKRLLWDKPGPWGRVGCQQVHLARGFSGSVRSVRTEQWLNIGEPGQGDLVGWLSLWLPPYGLVAVKLELEIKMPSGRLSDKQKARRAELARAGAIYLSTKSVKSSVDQIVLVRNQVSSGKMTIAQAVEAAEGLGW